MPVEAECWTVGLRGAPSTRKNDGLNHWNHWIRVFFWGAIPYYSTLSLIKPRILEATFPESWHDTVKKSSEVSPPKKTPWAAPQVVNPCKSLHQPGTPTRHNLRSQAFFARLFGSICKTVAPRTLVERGAVVPSCRRAVVPSTQGSYSPLAVSGCKYDSHPMNGPKKCQSHSVEICRAWVCLG